MIDKLWLKSMRFFSHTCHQKASRSYFIKNYQMPICARCLGLTIGYILGFCFFNSSINIIAYILLIIPLIIDGLLQLKTNYESTNLKRLITGIFAGIGYISIFIIIINKVIH